jgi:hypothetical protein
MAFCLSTAHTATVCVKAQRARPMKDSAAIPRRGKVTQTVELFAMGHLVWFAKPASPTGDRQLLLRLNLFETLPPSQLLVHHPDYLWYHTKTATYHHHCRGLSAKWDVRSPELVWWLWKLYEEDRRKANCHSWKISGIKYIVILLKLVKRR